MAEKKPEKKAGGYLKKLAEHNKDRRKRLKDAYEGEYIGHCGDPALQWCSGGYIRGRLNLLWGPTKSGKSTFSLKWAGLEQKKRGGKVLIFDSEYNYDIDNPKTIERFEQCGLDPDDVVVIQGNTFNELFFGLADLEADIKKGDLGVSAIVWDSVGGVSVESALKKIAEGEISDAGNSFGGNAKFINPVIQFFLRMAGDYAITCFFVQHCIMNMEQYGKRFLLIGGQKLRFLVHCSLFFETVEAQDARLAVGQQAIEKSMVEETVAVGKRIRSYCDKSRQLVEGRKVEFWFDFEKVEFARAEETLFELAKRLDIIGDVIEVETDKKGNVKVDEDTGKPVLKKKKGYFCYPSDSSNPTAVQWHGKPGVMEALKNKELYDKIFEDCMNSAKKNASDDQRDLKELLAPDEDETEEKEE